MVKETLHIYTRVSTQTQQDEGTSLESQREFGIKKARELGFSAKVWNEGGASSNYEDFENRPVLLQLLMEIDAGNVSHLWVYNNDRLSRNPVTAQTIRMKLQKYAVTLHTSTGTFDFNNRQDRFLKAILDEVAQLDNAQRAESTRQGRISRIRQGFWMGGPPPFGYKIQDKKLVLHAKESKWLKKIYEWYSVGKSTEWIKSTLIKEGVETRRGGVWSLGSIQKILQNTHPIGHYTYVDSKTAETIKCSCPSIVSISLWNLCQEKRKEILARRGQNNRTTRFYLLRNLLYCNHCGSPMSGRIKEDKKEYLYYCPRKERQWVKSAPKGNNKWKRGDSCSMTRSLNIRATDDLIINKVLPFALNKPLIDKALKEHAKGKGATAENNTVDLKQLQIRQKRLSKELDTTIQSIADVEAAKMLGKQDERVAKKILESLNLVFRETEAKIEQCKIQVQELKNTDRYIEMKTLKPSLHYVDLKGVDFNPHFQRHLKSIIDRIDVSYNQEQSEHQLVERFKLPLINGKNELALNLKKNKKAA